VRGHLTPTPPPGFPGRARGAVHRPGPPLQREHQGRVDLEPWLTGTVPVDGVPQAFQDPANPEAHAKILVVPGG